MSEIELPKMEPELPEIYYDDACKDYWRKDTSGFYRKVNETSVRRKLMIEGFSSERKGFVSPVDEAIDQIQMDRAVFFAGSLAGHASGLYEVEGRKKILVTDSPNIIEPVEGDWPMLRTVVDNLLGDQQDYFWSWLKIAYESLTSGKHRPGQALVLAGPKNCGKSLLQALVTELLGGRVGHPYQYMVEATPFNSHLFGAEHLMIDDQAGSKNATRRATFGQNLKGLINGQAQHYHAKHRAALSLKPFWRLTISVNDDPDHLELLPNLDPSLSDKLMILRAEHHEMPMPTHIDDGRLAFWEKLCSELPHMLFDLMHGFEIPEEIRSERFGVMHYHDPEVLRALGELATETILLGYIDLLYFDGQNTSSHRARAEDIQADLARSEYARAVEKLVPNPRIFGRYLGLLEERHPGRVKKTRQKGKNLWTIYPPPVAEESGGDEEDDENMEDAS